jgi:hypothetical protein
MMSMKKIEYVSLFFRLFFQVTFVVLIAAQVIGWIYAPSQVVLFNVIPLSYRPLVAAPLDINAKIAGFFVSSILLAIKLIIVYWLIKLFRLYQRHEFFSAENVLYIRNTGYALLLFEIVKPCIDFSLGFILTAANPPGYRVAMATFGDANVGMILTALVIILNSWIMSEGCKLKDEQQLII